MWKSTSASGALSHFSAMAWPRWLGRAVRNRHRHAIEQASRRWRRGRRDDSARTRRKFDFHAGRAYQIYMVLLVVFCTNAVNIYAGVNGLECGQVYVIACSILAMAAIELQDNRSENYTLSLVFLPPFIATTLALLRSNWYPARVFVGDTFTNYAGMALAVVRSRRPAVLRCLHFINTTRVHQTRPWVVSFLILGPFGPNRDAPRRWRSSGTSPSCSCC